MPADCIEQVVCIQGGEVLKPETLHAWASSEDSSDECLEIEATAAARYTKRQRETACGALPGKPTGTPNLRGTWKPIAEEEHDFIVEVRIQRTPLDAVLGRSRKNDNKFKILWTSSELNIEQNLSLPTGEDRRIQQINEESKQDPGEN